MKKSSVLCALILVLPLTLFAAPDDSVVLFGDFVRTNTGETTFKGSVSATFKDGSQPMSMSADEIALEQKGGKNSLRSSGAATIRIAGRTIHGTGLTTALGFSSATVYMANPQGIDLGGPDKKFNPSDPSALYAASRRSVLVLGTSSRTENDKAIYTGSVSLLFKYPSESFKVSAREITFDQVSDRQGGVCLLKCSGETVIESDEWTVKGKDITFEFSDMRGNIYMVNSNGIILNGSAKVNAGSFTASGAINNAGRPVPPLLESANRDMGIIVYPATSLLEKLISKPLPKFDAPLPADGQLQLQGIPVDSQPRR